MISSATSEYYQICYGSSLNPYLTDYISKKEHQNKRLNRIIGLFLLIIFIVSLIISKPIFAYNTIDGVNKIKEKDKISRQIDFENEIRNKYKNCLVTFPNIGIAHIKKTEYINSKPIKINIVEINTKINKNLKISPQLSSKKLNSKSTVRNIAQRNNAIIAINGGYFKPQTGVPLGALMIDRKILTGPIFNRVGIAIFDDGENIKYKMDNIDFKITLYGENTDLKIDNINQPRILSTYSLLYTNSWGKYSPIAPKHCYNLLIKNNKPDKISANPIELNENEYVIQASKDIIRNLVKNNKNLYLDIKLQESLKGAKHIIGAGPYLVKDSKIFVDTKYQKLNAISGKNPRSAIGYTKENNLILVTIDGREKSSVGMTLFELAKLMKKIDCEYAMNFDGGSSSALYINGKIENSALNQEGVRVSNALTIIEDDKDEYQLSSI